MNHRSANVNRPVKRFSGQAAGSKAKRQWLCDECSGVHSRKSKVCELCGSTNLLYFQSKHESYRWRSLKLLQMTGQISNLTRQVKFLLMFDGDGEIRTPAGRTMSHTVDFQYTENGRLVLEDAKGIDTDLGHLKRELVRVLTGHEIRIY